jgi:hypothetical protein
MKIYDYTKYSKCFLGPSVDGKLDEIIETINKGLLKSMPKSIHPKEFERLERLKKRDSEDGFIQALRPQYISASNGKKKKDRQRPFDYNNGVMIMAGSCGFGTKDIKYFDDRFSELNEYLKSSDFHILFVRGNNDDPSYFDEEKINYSNIKSLSSNCIVKFKDFSCMCIGGGISFDREWKKAKGKEFNTTMYWENEGVDFDIKDVEQTIKDNNIVCVISHEIPSFVTPCTGSYKNNRWFKNDKELLADTIKCRSKLDSIYNELVKSDKKPYVWWHTHTDVVASQIVNDIMFCSYPYIENLNETVKKQFGKNITEEEKIEPMKYSKYITDTSEWTMTYEDLTWNTDDMPHLEPINYANPGAGMANIQPARLRDADEGPRVMQYNDAPQINVEELYENIRNARVNAVEPVNIAVNPRGYDDGMAMEDRAQAMRDEIARAIAQPVMGDENYG